MIIAIITIIIMIIFIIITTTTIITSTKRRIIKSYEQFFLPEVRHTPIQMPLDFDGDPDHGPDPEIS